MAKTKVLNSCDGTFEGLNIKKGTIKIDRLAEGELTLAVREILESQDNKDWTDQYFIDKLEMTLPTLLDKKWFVDAICGMDCGGSELFEVLPERLEFPATGGTKSVQINVPADAAWTVK